MKINAMRLLGDLGIPFELRPYEVDPEDLASGAGARKVILPPERVFETRVATGDERGVSLVAVVC